VDQVTRIDEPAVRQIAGAAAAVSVRLARLSREVGGWADAHWMAVESEAWWDAGGAADRLGGALATMAAEVSEFGAALEAAGTGYHTSDDASARRLGAAGSR
jgi:hypothetical protein